jgi:hypothetical protein
LSSTGKKKTEKQKEQRLHILPIGGIIILVKNIRQIHPPDWPEESGEDPILLYRALVTQQYFFVKDCIPHQ